MAEAEEKSGEIRVYISPIMFIMAVFFVAFGMAYEFACSLTAVVLHELAHAKAASRLGYRLSEVRLMPYGAALCGSADMTPKHEAVIAAAGPALNLVLGTVFAALWWLIPTSYAFTSQFCACNLYIGLFNLLPVYPLDGGRMMLALLSVKLPRKKAYLIMRIISAAVGLTAIALFILSAFTRLNLCFLSVGLFMIVSAFIPDARARYYALFAKSSLSGRLKRTVKMQRFAVDGTVTLGELLRRLDPDRLTVFSVYSDGKKAGELDEFALYERIKSDGYGVAVAAALKNAEKY